MMPKYKKIYENSEFIVINKPAGLLTHGADHIDEKTLVDQLLADYPKIAKIGEDPSRPGIMHRLDRLASGLLVIARTQDSFDNLKQQFKKRKIKKIYTALVYGRIDKDEDLIDFPIERSSKGHKMAAKPKTIKGAPANYGRQAITEFTVLKHFINFTLLEVKIKTGRTHQIRVHLAAYGHPVVGDDLYSTKKTREKNTRLRKQEKLNPYRYFLVANKLSFKDLSGQAYEFTIELPEELKTFLEGIK